MPFHLPLSELIGLHKNPSWRGVWLVGLLAACFWLPRLASAIEHVTVSRDGKTSAVSGRLLVTAKDGGILLLARDGVIWAVTPAEQAKRSSDKEAFKSFPKEEIAKRVLADLPRGFRVYHTTHYLICYDTSNGYAQWCGALFERLYSAFTNYWTRRGFDLSKPEFPLVAVLFADRDAFLEHSKSEFGDSNQSISGYYSPMSNQMILYDLTGTETNNRGRGRGKSSAQINQLLMQPDAARSVATVVHEATHQISFNCGLQTRMGDNPLWFSEGIAVYFETPDLRSAKGWSGIGAINSSRLQRFQEYMSSRPADSLETLLRDDSRFRDTKQAIDAYAEAWTLTDFLLHRHPKEYVKYLDMISKKTPLIFDKPEQRLEQFRAIFGDMEKLDAEFIKYANRLRS